jgi:hypothetical protein
VADVRLLVALLFALALAGCGGDGGGGAKMKSATMIDWDLSHSHTTSDVDWPKPDLDAVDVQPEGAVRIELPGGRTFEAADGELRHIYLKREGDTVTEVNIQTVPLDREAAHAQAVEWAGDWGLARRPLDDWASQTGDGGYTPNATSAMPPGDRGPDRFGADVQLLHSFNEERPGIAELSLSWLRAAPGAAGDPAA